jgi:hypothetical protein
MTPQLRALLEAVRATTEKVQRKKAIIIPWVFHRNGLRLKGFAKPGVRRAGRLGPWPDLPRHSSHGREDVPGAGVPAATAMVLVGHRTMSVYKITDEVMLREGVSSTLTRRT